MNCYTLFMADLKKKNPFNKYPERTGDAIVQRYRKTRCKGIKFIEIISCLKAKKPTGDPTEENIERAALAVYNGNARLCEMYAYLRDPSVPPG